jgi:alpha-glucosidase
MLDIIKYWLDEGADGFRIDAINFMFETEGFPDEAYIDAKGDKTLYDNLHHVHTKDRPESYEFIYDVREIMDKYVESTEDKVTRLMMTEAYAPIGEQVKWYGANTTRRGAHFPFNFVLITEVDKSSNATDFVKTVDSWVR